MNLVTLGVYVLRHLLIFITLLGSVELLATQPSNAYFDIAFTDVRESSDINGNTYRLGLELSDSVYFDAEKTNLKGSSYFGGEEFNVSNYALGVKFDLTKDAFFYADYSFLEVSDEDNEKSDGNILAVGIRGNLNKSFNYTVEFNRTEFDGSSESETGSIIGIGYVMSEGADLFFEKIDWLESDIYRLGLRFSF